MAVFISRRHADYQRKLVHHPRGRNPGLLSEWHGERLIAVDIPPGADPHGLFTLMKREVDEAGAFWEWADARPFSITQD